MDRSTPHGQSWVKASCLAWRYRILLLICVVVGGCLGTPASKTRQLQPGMTPEQVKAVLGEPSQSQFIAQRLVWKYGLMQPWKGSVPYYLVFDSQTGTLREWYANEAEYTQQQMLWLQAIPPTQRMDINVR